MKNLQPLRVGLATLLAAIITISLGDITLQAFNGDCGQYSIGCGIVPAAIVTVITIFLSGYFLLRKIGAMMPLRTLVLGTAIFFVTVWLGAFDWLGYLAQTKLAEYQVLAVWFAISCALASIIFSSSWAKEVSPSKTVKRVIHYRFPKGIMHKRFTNWYWVPVVIVIIVIIGTIVAVRVYSNLAADDQQSSQDIVGISARLDQDYAHGQSLPNNLQQLPFTMDWASSLLNDRLSDYQYQKTSNSAYRICAKFNLPNDPLDTNPIISPQVFKHGWGNVCYNFNATGQPPDGTTETSF